MHRLIDRYKLTVSKEPKRNFVEITLEQLRILYFVLFYCVTGSAGNIFGKRPVDTSPFLCDSLE